MALAERQGEPNYVRDQLDVRTGDHQDEGRESAGDDEAHGGPGAHPRLGVVREVGHDETASVT